MLRIVVENLAENAIRYAGPGSTLTLVGDGAGVLEAGDTGGASRRRTCRGSSSASTAATGPAPRAARASVSRS